MIKNDSLFLKIKKLFLENKRKNITLEFQIIQADHIVIFIKLRNFASFLIFLKSYM